MAVNSKLNFDIYARDHASPVFNKFGKAVDTSGKKMGGASSATKKLLGAFAGAAVISKVAGFLKDANTEARESQKVNALTANVIKTTGAEAWTSVKGISAYSTALSNKTAVDDEAIQSGANMLLTFKNVQNQVGQGANIFDRATAAAVDLSASGFGSITGMSKTLGKALNDPVKGLTALGRAGVTFTQGQKDQIAAMVKAGDTLGAQKIILKEVESQAKGAAAAQATSADKLKVSWANFKEEIGTKLIPVLDSLASAGSDSIAWMSENGDSIATFGTALGIVVIGLGAYKVAMATSAAASAIYAAGTAGATAGTWSLNVALRANPIGLVVTALTALGVGVMLAWKKFPAFRAAVTGALRGVGAVGKWLWNGVFQPVFKFIVTGLGHLMIMFGKFLVSISRIPGFGWAKKAGELMQGAGKKALGLAENIKKIPDKKVKISAETRAAIDRLNLLQWKIKDLKGKTIAIKVVGGKQLAYAKGTKFHPGGMAWVGEAGPELVDLPRGSKVYTANESKQMSGGGATPTNAAGGDYFDYDRLAQAMAGLGIAVQVGIDKRTSAKIVAAGTHASARLHL